MLQRLDDMKKGSCITVRILFLQRTRNSFTRNVMVIVTFQIKPHAQEVSKFWSNIWLIPGNFSQNGSWLPKVKERLIEIDKQEDIRISFENVKTAIRKMINWKAPGSDCVQGYLFKRFSTLHSGLT